MKFSLKGTINAKGKFNASGKDSNGDTGTLTGKVTKSGGLTGQFAADVYGGSLTGTFNFAKTK